MFRVRDTANSKDGFRGGMKSSRIEEARREALRFADLATKMLRQLDGETLLFGGKLSGQLRRQLRRASLDLTRSLAEMRKP